jgi:hypothetical protein
MRHGHVIVGDNNSASVNIGKGKETEVERGRRKGNERDGRKGKGERGGEEGERSGGVGPEDKDGMHGGVIRKGENEAAEEQESARRVTGDEDGEAVRDQG